MSDILALAVRRARFASQTPSVVNVYDPREHEVIKLKKEIEALLDRNEELVTTARNLRISRQRLFQELVAAKKGITNLMKIPEYAANSSPMLAEIVSATAQEFEIGVKDIRSESRTRPIVLARQSAIYLCHKISKRSCAAIGRFFQRDHTTVLHALEQISKRRQIEPELDGMLIAVEVKFEDVSSQTSVERAGMPDQ